MPKKKNIASKKKKEIENLLQELKENSSDITKIEIEELESLLDDILQIEDVPLWKRLAKGIGTFTIHLFIMYFISILAFGLFFEALAINNKWLIFWIALVISFILTLFEDVPRNPFRNHFVSINLMIFSCIVLGIYILDRDVYSIFAAPITWVFYLLTVVIIYYVIDSSIARGLFKK